jgi:LacI family transcriptional regulator
VLRALHDGGLRVPDDMAVIGTDGIDLGRYTTPALTTIHHPRPDLGRLAVETVCDQIDGGPEPETERVLPTRLIVRESCGGPVPVALPRGRGDT